MAISFRAVEDALEDALEDATETGGAGCRACTEAGVPARDTDLVGGACEGLAFFAGASDAVSYTHLTLPTKA